MGENSLPSDTAIAAIGMLLGDRARAAMLHHLMKGLPLTARQLAAAGGITPQTASSHIAKLTEAGLITMEKSGRNRYFQLAAPHIVDAICAITAISPAEDTDISEQITMKKARHWRLYRQNRELTFARSCYDHLAGRLGSAVTQGLITQKYIKQNGDNFEVTKKGASFFKGLHIDLSALEKQPRHFARACSDWTEQAPHLAGALGKALFDFFLDQEWILRVEGERHILLTQAGAQKMPDLFAFSLDTLLQDLPGDD